MSEEEGKYNGSTEILRKLSDAKNVSNKVLLTVLIESQIHTIKLIHETNKRLNTFVKDVEDIKKDGAKISPRSAILYASLFWGLDRSGVFDSVVGFAVKNLDLLWKAFF